MITMSKVLAKWSYFAHNGNIYQIWYPNFVAIYHDSLAIDYNYGPRMANKQPFILY